MINKNLPDLLEVIDTVPAEHRQWDEDIICYHLTSVDNVDGIRNHGFIPNSSKQSYDRPECVYFFLDHDLDSDSNAHVLIGDVDQYALITLIIPKAEIGKMKFDGLYNMSFDFGYSAIQYFDDVPAAWIKNVEIKNLKG